MDITHIDLVHHNMSMPSAKVRLICLWLSPEFIYFIEMQIWHMTKLDCDVNRCTSIDLLYQNTCRTCGKFRFRHMDIAAIFFPNMDMACAEGRVRCAGI